MGNRSGLVDDAIYADTGCDIAPKCLECPLARCRYDESLQVVRRKERREVVRALRDRGLTVEEIASALSVSRRTVFRAMEGRAA